MNQIATIPTKSVLVSMADRFGMEPQAFEATVRATCMKTRPGDPPPTKEEFAAFLLVAKEYGLNPLTKEIHAFTQKGGGIVPIVSIDGWVNLINSHPKCDGFEFAYEHDNNGNLVSITCRMFRKDRSRPVEVTEYLSECIRGTEPWKMKHRMLRHKALIQGARYAFGFAGIYEEDEAERILQAKDITPPVTAFPAAPPPPPPEDDTPSAAAAPASSQANVRAPSSPEHTADRRAAPSSPEQPATHPASFDDVLKLADQHLAKVSDQPALHEAWQRFWKEGLMKWKEVAKADQPRAMEVLSKHKARLAKTGEVQSPDTGFTITKLVAELDAALARCRDRASLSDTYTKIVQPLIEAGTISDEHVNGPLGVVFTQHSERIEEIEDVPMEEPPPAEEDDGFPGDR